MIFNRLFFIFILFAFVLAGCAAFEEVDPYANTNLKTLKNISNSKEDLAVEFEPALGVTKRIRVIPWASSKVSYIEKGLARSAVRPLWEQILRTQTPDVSGNISSLSVAEKIEIFLESYDGLPSYLKSTIRKSYRSLIKNKVMLRDIETLNKKLDEVGKQTSKQYESLLTDVHNLREMLGEIKLQKSRLSDIQARIPAQQIRAFIESLTFEANNLANSILDRDQKFQYFLKVKKTYEIK